MRRGARPLIGGKARQKHRGELVVDERKRIAHLVDARGLRRVGARATKGLVHFRLAEKHGGDIGRRSMREHGAGGSGLGFYAIRRERAVRRFGIFSRTFSASRIGCIARTCRRLHGFRLQAKRRTPAGEPVYHARRRIHIDFGRFAQRIDSRDILRKHLGRRKIGRRLASKRTDPRERRALHLFRRRRPEVDKAHIEEAFLNLLGKRKARRANHHIGERDVAMDKAAFKEIKVRKQVKHVAADLSSHKRGHAAGPVNRKSVAYMRERFAAHPFHNDGRRARDLAHPIQMRKSLEARNGLVTLEFLTKRGFQTRSIAFVFSIARTLVALGHNERFQCELLAKHIGRAHDRPNAAATARRLVNEERAETAPVRIERLALHANSWFEMRNAHYPSAAERVAAPIDCRISQWPRVARPRKPATHARFLALSSCAR